MRMLRIGLAQINCIVGDLSGNVEKMNETIAKAGALEVDFLAFPELSITGYPPEDLLLKPRFISDNREALERVVKRSADFPEMAIVVGFVDQAEDNYNAAALIHGGRLIAAYHKVHLPNYGVFDEKRYFREGFECPVFSIGGVNVGISVCEDIWYPEGPPHIQALAGDAELVVSINASPYHAGKGKFREQMLATRATDNTVAVAYVNLVGGQDELIFDGHSMMLDHTGTVIAAGGQFEEDLVVADVDAEAVVEARLRDPRRRSDKRAVHGLEERVTRAVVSGGPSVTKTVPLPKRDFAYLDPVEEVYRALVLGVRDYVRKNGFSHAVIALSGGVDSSLTLMIAADALGAANVTSVFMPSPYSAPASRQDARRLAENLGVRLIEIPIDQAFGTYLELLAPEFANLPPDITEENVQARIRGNLIMALSNKFGWLVLSTGNKSEMSVGYATLYGDMSGGFAVLKDVPKTLVYRLARHRNTIGPAPVIPDRVLTRAPSAELRPDQTDQDTLPPYEVLDPILQAYVEENRSVDEIVELGFDRDIVKRVVNMVDRSEYKRRQAPPGIKITIRAFGKDWRLPITNWYHENR